MAQPIWKDYFVDFGNVSSAEYTIQANGGVIYEGVAVRRPTDTTLKVRINDICESYLSAALPYFVNIAFTIDPISRTFEVYSNGILKASVEFYMDYSYDATRTTNVASSPIIPLLDVRQPLIFTQYNATQIDVDIYYADGSHTLIPISALGGDYNNDYNNDYSTSERNSGSIYVNLNTYQPTKVIIRGITYQVVTSCHKYALYYVNAYGGWDSLLMEGRPTETDTIARKEVSLDYNNANVTERGRVNYLNEIVKGYTLRTGFLTDAQAAKMWHLLESTNVYLYDLTTRKMMPCVITNTDAPFKTFRGEGGKFFQYEVNVELSQSRVRR